MRKKGRNLLQSLGLMNSLVEKMYLIGLCGIDGNHQRRHRLPRRLDIEAVVGSRLYPKVKFPEQNKKKSTERPLASL